MRRGALTSDQFENATACRYGTAGCKNLNASSYVTSDLASLAAVSDLAALIGAGAVTTAEEAMKLIFRHEGLDVRHLPDLMPPRLGVISWESVATAATVRRLERYHLAAFLGGDQIEPVTDSSFVRLC